MKAALSIPIKDDFDRLIRVSSDITGRKQDNRYDVNGIRKRKLDSNGNASSEFTAGISTVASKAATSGSSAPTISYIMGHQLLGCEVDGAFQYWLNDHLGTVRDVVDENGAVIRSQEYDEHGNLISSSGTGTFAPKTYQGALSVNDDTADSGLWLMGHRHYDSRVGRFISRDPIGFRGGLNLFAGASLDPIGLADPSGLLVETAAAGASGTTLCGSAAAAGGTSLGVAIGAGATGIGVGGGLLYMGWELYKVNRAQREADATARWQAQRQVEQASRPEQRGHGKSWRPYEPTSPSPERIGIPAGGITPPNGGDCDRLLKECYDKTFDQCSTGPKSHLRGMPGALSGDASAEASKCLATYWACVAAVKAGDPFYVIQSANWRF